MNNILACVTGFKSMPENRAHGTNHAGLGSLEYIAKSEQFHSIHYYTELADRCASVGQVNAGITTPSSGKTTVSVYDIDQLYYTSAEYTAIYSAGGGLINDNRQVHWLRPARFNVPVVCEIDCTHSRAQWSGLLASLLGGAVRPTDGFVYKSKRTAEIFARVFSHWSSSLGFDFRQPQFIISPNPVNLALNRKNLQLRASARKVLGLSDSDVMFLAFSRIEPDTKGDVFSLLARWREICDVTSSPILVLAGAAWDQGFLIEMRRLTRELRLSQNVILLPNPFDFLLNAKSSLMSAADVFIHTSTGIEESAPLTIAEAMAHSLPVICAEWAGMPEQVPSGEAGFVIKTVTAHPTPFIEAMLWGSEWLRANQLLSRLSLLDPLDFVNRVVQLSSDRDLRARFGASSRRHAESKFAPEKAATARIDFVRQLHAEAKCSKDEVMQQRPIVPAHLLLESAVDSLKLRRETEIEFSGSVDRHLQYWIPNTFGPFALEVIQAVGARKLSVGEVLSLVLINDGSVVDFDLLWGSEEGLETRVILQRLLGAGIFKVVSW